MLHHLAVVARDVGLALHAVDHEKLEALALRGAHLEPRGERGTAQAHHAGIAHAGDKLLLGGVLGRLERGVGLHLAVGDDLHHGCGRARGQLLGRHLGDRAGNARVDRGAQALDLADQRADIYMVASLTTGLAGAPMCIFSGMSTRSGDVMDVQAKSRISLHWGGCTPPLVLCRENIGFPSISPPTMRGRAKHGRGA